MVEGIYAHSGHLAPLDEIYKLKEKYKWVSACHQSLAPARVLYLFRPEAVYGHDIAPVSGANLDSLHSQYLLFAGVRRLTLDTGEKGLHLCGIQNLHGHIRVPLRCGSVCRYRLVLDQSLALGVLGQHGRGACEHWGLKPGDAEIVSASMGDCSHLPWQQYS